MMAGVSFFGLFLMILFWGGLIVLAIWLVKILFANSQLSTSTARGEKTSATRILDQRFARGEISPEQYRLMKNDLEQ